MSKEFYIIEARDVNTNAFRKRKIYTSEKQYKNQGLKIVNKYSKYYNITVTKYICTEDVEILNSKPKQR